MLQTIRTTLLISSTALFAAACTNMPMDGQNGAYYNTGGGYNTGAYNTASAAPSARIPEAGPLSTSAPVADNTSLVAASVPVAAAPQNVPAATAPQNVPVATVPQMPVPAATNNTTTTVAAVSNGSPYGTYAAAPAQSTPTYSNTATTNMVDYSQPQNTANDTYTSYGTGNTGTTTASNPATTNYYSDNSGYDTYASNNTGDGYTNTGNTTHSGGYTNTAAAGGSAIQVFASGSQAKAEQIRQNMISQGLPAVVDAVNGLYKVRVPYPNVSAARANLIRVRQTSGEAGAFVVAAR